MKSAQPLIAILVCAAAVGAQAQTIERMKMTDGDLNCQQIYTEIKQMDVVMAQANAQSQAAAPAPDNTVANQVAGAVAQQAATQVSARLGGFLGGGGGGLFGGVGASTPLGNLFGSAAQQVAQQAVAAPAPASAQQGNPALAQQAAGRKEHLTGLFLGKQCKMSDVK